MANYVKSVLYIEEKYVEKVSECLRSDEADVDFNNLIPMPDWVMRDCYGKEADSLSAYRYLHGYSMDMNMCSLVNMYQHKGENLDDVISRLEREGHIDLKLGERAFLNEQEHGDTSWYLWTFKNWGTKYNAVRTGWKKNKVYFETPWSAPFPIFQALAERFPDAVIECVYAGEDIGNCGCLILKNGCIASEFYPERGTDEAKRIYQEVWEVDE